VISGARWQPAGHYIRAPRCAPACPATAVGDDIVRVGLGPGPGVEPLPQAAADDQYGGGFGVDNQVQGRRLVWWIGVPFLPLLGVAGGFTMPEFPNLSASCQKAIGGRSISSMTGFPVGARIEAGSQLMLPR
jgi:hypothetical protein